MAAVFPQDAGLFPTGTDPHRFFLLSGWGAAGMIWDSLDILEKLEKLENLENLDNLGQPRII